MNIGQAFASKYLKASDVPEDHPVTVRIDRVEIEELGQGRDKESKPVAYFIGKQKGMVLNKTNCRVIANAYGEETDGWHGKAVQIISTEVEFQGDMVQALRIRIPKGTAAPAQSLQERGQQVRKQASAPSQAPFSEEDQHFDEDSIPF